MNKGRVLPAALFILNTALLVSSCGGGGGASSNTTPVASPQASLSPGSLAFGNETIGVASSVQTVTLADAGNAALSISGVSITGTDAGDFSQTNTCGTSVAAGKNCNISVTFKPSATGTRTASLSVSDNATGSPQSVALTGTGVTPPPAVTLAPTSLDFGNETVGLTSAGQTVTLTDSGQGTLDISGISITGTNAGDFSQSNVCGTSLAAGKSCNIAVMFTPTASGTRTASLTVTDNASGSPQSVGLTGTGVIPVLSVSPTSATVLLGAAQAFGLNTQATCTSTLFGNVPVTGSGTTYTAAYTAPQAVPTAWTDTVSCTETADPTQTVTAQITLQYPVPVITGTSALGGSEGTLWALQTVSQYFSINGSGFLPDLTLTVPNNSDSICGIKQISWTEIQVNFALSGSDGDGSPCSPTSPTSWDPGFIEFTVSDPPTGHGGGTSNTGRIAFLGYPYMLAFNASDAFLLDPDTSTVYKFKLADGSPDGNFTFSPGTGTSISVDDVTGKVVIVTDKSVEAFDPVSNAKVYELDAQSPGSLHGGAAGGGWAVLSSYDGTEGIPNTLDAINLQQGGLPIHVSYKGTPQEAPWNFQLTKLNNSPMEVVWSAYSGVLSTVAIGTQTVIKSLTIPNIFVLKGALSTQIFRGGWQLQVFNSGPAIGTAVLLSNYDKLLVEVDLNTMKEIRRVDLTAPFKNANPSLPELQSFRIAKDEVDGSIVVAFADPVNGKTVLYNVDASGNMTRLNATAPFLATGLQESSDGTQIYWGNRSTFAITPKQ